MDGEFSGDSEDGVISLVLHLENVQWSLDHLGVYTTSLSDSLVQTILLIPLLW